MSTIQLSIDGQIQGVSKYMSHEGQVTSTVSLEPGWSWVTRVDISFGGGEPEPGLNYHVEFTSGDPGAVFATVFFPKGEDQAPGGAFSWPSEPVAVRVVCPNAAWNYMSPFNTVKVILTGE